MTNQWPDENLDVLRRQIEAWLDELETAYEEKIDAIAADLAEALDLLRACFTAREATSEERKRFDALMEKHKEKP